MNTSQEQNQKRNRRSANNIIPAKVWETLRAEFESGNYSGIEDFYKRYVVTCVSKKQRPGPKYLHKIASRKGWKKNANLPKIAAECQRLSIEMYAKLGLPPEGAARAVVVAVQDMQLARDALIAKMKELAVADGTELDEKKVAELVERGRAYLSEKRAAAPYLVEYHKVTGAYAPTKYQHSGRVGLTDDKGSMTARDHLEQARRDLALAESLLAKGEAPWKIQASGDNGTNQGDDISSPTDT